MRIIITILDTSTGAPYSYVTIAARCASVIFSERALMPTFVSAEGLEKMNEEMTMRKTTLRKEIAERISAAKELGDLSENFEYQQAKEDQGSNEVRIVELEGMIKDAVVVEQQKGGDTITLGTTFVAKTGALEKTFQIVGSNEAKPLEGKISNESPLGQAFIGRKDGEVVEVSVPSGTITYKIISIT
jgi:transcription elongation factor GreA